MTGPSSRPLRVAEALYRAALLVYPSAFRRAYGHALLQVFRAHARDAYRHGVGALLRASVVELGDLAITALKEQGDTVRAIRARRIGTTTLPLPVGAAPASPPRLWGVSAATLLAFAVSLLASLNLYLLEDANPLTPLAYGASPVLRLSYDGVYLSALAAGVAICAVAGYTVARADAPVLRGLIAVALLVVPGGFGGMAVRHPATFLALAGAFTGLVLLSTLVGWMVAVRARPRLGRRSAAILGACAGTGAALLVNLAVLVPHTLALNPVSHPLYMQGRIGETRLNSLLLGLGLEALTIVLCTWSIRAALRAALPGHDGGRPSPTT